jgi:hypothetical protein
LFHIRSGRIGHFVVDAIGGYFQIPYRRTLNEVGIQQQITLYRGCDSRVFIKTSDRFYILSRMRAVLTVTGVLVVLLVQGAAQSTASSPANKSPERLVYVIPNNRTVEHQKSFARISMRTKFKLSAEDAFDPYGFASAGVNAGIEHTVNDHPQYGQGVAGFGKRYGADFADEATSELLGGGVYPALFHQDPRYFRMERGNIWKRCLYALSRSVWTKDDIGELEFNGSAVFGDYSAAAISNLYYPAADRTYGQTLQRGSILLLEDSAFNLLKEFWPDVHDRLRHKKSRQMESPPAN